MLGNFSPLQHLLRSINHTISFRSLIKQSARQKRWRFILSTSFLVGNVAVEKFEQCGMRRCESMYGNAVVALNAGCG